MNFKNWTPLILALSVAAAPAGAGAPKDWSALSGSVSAVTQWRTVDVRDQETWSALWKEHTAHDPEAPAAPFVDFTRERVIAVFLGSRSRGGHGIGLEVKQNKEADALEVFIKEEKPRRGSFGITMMTQPFAFRRETNNFKTVVFPQSPDKYPGPNNTPVNGTPKKPRGAINSLATRNRVAALTENFSGLRDSVGHVFDGAALRGGASGAPAVVFTGGKPLPGQGPDQGKPLPGRERDSGKPLPGQDRQDKPLPGAGKPLPGQGGKPLPGQGGKPLPGGGVVQHPRPVYPGGPLPDNDPRLDGAGRTYSTYGMDYIGYWNGKTFYSTGRGTLTRDGKNPGTRYQLTLNSRQMKKRYDFYYDRQDKQYYWVPDEIPLGGRRTRDLTILFSNTAQQPLMEWETERFEFSLTGSQLSIDSQSGAYRYSGTFTTDANDPSVVTAHLTAGAKVLTAPDAAGISAGIQATSSGVKLVIHDKWAAQYAGESLEITAVVRWDDGSFWRRDPVVFQSSARSPLSFAAAGTLEHEFSVSKKGKYYLESWSFRRADSKISSGQWINKGKGNTITR